MSSQKDHPPLHERLRWLRNARARLIIVIIVIAITIALTSTTIIASNQTCENPIEVWKREIHNIHRKSPEEIIKFFSDLHEMVSHLNLHSYDKAQILLVAHLKIFGDGLLSHNKRIIQDVGHKFSISLIQNPLCRSDALFYIRKFRTPDEYENQCLVTSYKRSLQKYRQHNLTTEFEFLYAKSLIEDKIPWEKRSRTPQVYIKNPTKLRSFPIWPDKEIDKSPDVKKVKTFLTENYKTFENEIDQIQSKDELWSDPYPFLNPGKKWGVFVMYHNRSWDETRCSAAPKTCALLKTILPLTNLPYFHPYNEEAGFFRIDPNGVIAPHSGPTNTMLNTHIGLRGVEGAKFWVDGQRVWWKIGETFTFEDSFEHYGRHDGKESRYIFMIRQMHPDVTKAHYQSHTYTIAGKIPSRF